jgi:uroporphyrin-III C-methyltransferase/precorrin-2 dehydrogenase/sirohydrochlorin ferrochelatase
MIFGRADEEISACRKAGVSVEVVPGITAAQGAASRLGLSLTHRAAARRLQYVTGHASNGRLPDDLDWRSLADPNATTAIYMPVRTLGKFSAQAIVAGLDPAMPAIAVCSATRPDESVIHASVASLPELLASAEWHGPVLVLIGRTLADAAIAKAAGVGG